MKKNLCWPAATQKATETIYCPLQDNPWFQSAEWKHVTFIWAEGAPVKSWAYMMQARQNS